MIGLLCAVFGLCVHLASWLLAYRLFEQGRACSQIDHAGFSTLWIAGAVGALLAPVLAFRAARPARVSA
jgi:hypothetical protein